ncbi:hypothetical protein LIER_00589 [Lithospermum erythrorhizon]|uniref:Uncharacterized protein n=1 Tax=Lithospermum erythrorhizon TaxID=34254 RepID=A0AAV3NMQ6_LITER
MTDIRVRGNKPFDEGQRRSPKRGRIWERLQKPKEDEPIKRPRTRSPRREDFRAPRTHQDPITTSYTPLKIPVGRIYAQMEDKRLFPRPQKIKAPPNRRDPKKYCEYHKDHRHDTDECRILKALKS